MMKNWFEELMSREQRRPQRHPLPRLVVYFWDGGTPVPHEIRDISTSGLFLRTTHRWYPGTLVTLTLQRTDKDDAGERPSITVQAKVMRSDEEGVGLRFVLLKSEEARRLQHYIAGGVDVQDEDALRRFLLAVLGRDSPPAMS
jgi:PilZ domain